MTGPASGRRKPLPVVERKDPMSEFFVYSVGKSNGESSLSSAPRPESHRQPNESGNAAHNPISMTSFPGNTRLIFKVDDTSKEVVVMIVDEASSEVIRTIPGEALKDIPSGGLLQKNG
jgi:hypothetical protein